MLNSWHQFPDNSLLPKNNKELLNPDYIWISHEHDDHYDLSFLNKVPKKTKIIIPDFPSKRMDAELKKNGFEDLVILSNEEEYSLSNDLSISMIFEKPFWTEHSSLVIKMGNTCILHNSDSYLTESQLKDIKEKFNPNIYVGQFSSTSPFPNIMKHWSDTKKNKFRKRHLDWALSRYTESVKISGAQITIPCAGPAINLDEKRIESTKSAITDKNGSLNYEYLHTRLKDELPDVEIKFMKIGESILKNGDNYIPSTKNSLQELDDILKNKMAFLNINKESVEITNILSFHRRIFRLACINAPYIVNKIDVIFSIYFYDLDERIDTFFVKNLKSALPTVELKTDTGNGKNDFFEKEYYQIQLHSSIWNEFVNNKILFDEIFYSQRQEIVESDLGYSSDLINLLRCMHSKNILKAANNDFLKIADELTTVQYNDNKYEISKFCPHVGASLEGVEVNYKGLIVCPAHKWEFNIVNGKCVSHDKTQSITSQISKD